MSVGAPQDMNSINSRLFGIAIQFRDLCVMVDHFNEFLGQFDTAALVAKGFTNQIDGDPDHSEVAFLRAAVTQMKAGVDVMRGQAAQAQANNFLFFSNKAVGPN